MKFGKMKIRQNGVRRKGFGEVEFGEKEFGEMKIRRNGNKSLFHVSKQFFVFDIIPNLLSIY